MRNLWHPHPHRGSHTIGWWSQAPEGSSNSPKPECSASLEEMVAYLPDMQNQPPLPPMGFELQPLVCGPPLFEDIPPPPGFWLPPTPRLGLPPALESRSPLPEVEETLFGIPKGAWLDLSSISTMHMTFMSNVQKGDLSYRWEMRVSGSLCLGPSDAQDLLGTRQRLAEQWMEHITLSGEVTVLL